MQARKPLILALSISMSVLIAAAPPPRGLLPCQVAKSWVAQHPDQLPRTIKEYAGFDAAYRKAIYLALPTESKLQLWREHYESFGQTLNFSLAQQAFLDSTLHMLEGVVAANQEVLPGTKADSTIRRMSRRGEELFGVQLAAMMFSKLGSTITEATAKEGDSPRIADCNCATSEDSREACGSYENWCHVNAVGQQCDQSWFGCGWWMTSGCNGMCGLHNYQ